MSFNIDLLVRNNIRKVKPYSSARDEFNGNAKTFLDANENSLGSPLTKWYNRYPDPYQQEVKQAIGRVKNMAAENIFLGNGSDECIDLLYRCFCEPGRDNVIICPPTYGMYEVSAAINDVEVRKAPLLSNFQLELEGIEPLIDEHTKIIWLCSPNNPSGNSLDYQDIEIVLNNFPGLVVVDEAYINFARQRSLTAELKEYPNLVVMQTLSKAWGLAALRLGMLFASPELVGWLNKIKPPYNINQATQDLALKALEEVGQVNDMIKEIVRMRDEVADALLQLPVVEKVYPSDANFLLVKVTDAKGIYDDLLAKGIVVRDRSKVPGCEGCLRITIGTAAENKRLIESLGHFGG
ncbi:MAG: histidinol-phosphate transaminase [Chitinophagaceae bacterium]